jgi:hypothetical protein
MQTETRTLSDRCAAYHQELFERSPAIQNIHNARLAEFLDPAYAKGYAAGKAQLLRDAFEARATPTPAVAPANPPSPEKLATRAAEIKTQAEAQGLVMSNIEAVRRAYQEAGIPI